jgi:hypothetical protein
LLTSVSEFSIVTSVSQWKVQFDEELSSSGNACQATTK